MTHKLDPRLLDATLDASNEAFSFLKQTNVKERAAFMYAVADRLEGLNSDILDVAHRETSLPPQRLTAELNRTIWQWRSYAHAVEQGSSVDVRIDTPDQGESNHDLRKMSIGVGPVVIFGSSNFPFAYSTAGGDTASAIGAGCPVVVKGHPAHPDTSHMVAEAIEEVLVEHEWPKGVFGHVLASELDMDEIELGKYLVTHPLVKAVGFTGSFQGGKALFDAAQRREEPIPVFAEMGSTNPVFVLPKVLEEDPVALAKTYATSLMLGVGQFCTNPGILIALASPAWEMFKATLKAEIDKSDPEPMLHTGISDHYEHRTQQVMAAPNVQLFAESRSSSEKGYGSPRVVTCNVETLIDQPDLQGEVFGPFAILASTNSGASIIHFAQQLKGQLTCSVWATPKDAEQCAELLLILKDKAGRLVFNGMPTGVDVVPAMQHGGPFPATTDARFTSVGSDAIRRFVRPVVFQNCPNVLLPEELRRGNPLEIMRFVNGVLR